MKSNYLIDTSNHANWDISVSRKVYELVCRSDFVQPGFALIRLTPTESSIGLRRKIVELKEGLSNLLQMDRGERLVWLNLTRFDQKNTTKPHRDGAPLESLLILGYEPTQVESTLTIADYSKCANDLGMTPEEFLETLNPMYEKGLEKLAPYTVTVEEFDRSTFQILVINNSSAAFGQKDKSWQGVLHSARVAAGSAPRVINSTCAYPISLDSLPVSAEVDVTEFLEGSGIESYS